MLWWAGCGGSMVNTPGRIAGLSYGDRKSKGGDYRGNRHGFRSRILRSWGIIVNLKGGGWEIPHGGAVGVRGGEDR
jgi:hypothetical protein